MKVYNGISIIILLLTLLIVTPANSASISLFDLGFNIDGSVSDKILGDPVPAEVDISGFDTVTGLGNITTTILGMGSHSFLAFFDHEIDDTINTFFNEYGAASGVPAAGQSWEIDEPGYIFGDIYDNFTDGNLDNTNALPLSNKEDVSMAIGWDFTLGLNEMALIAFSVTEIEPSTGFYLSHKDPDSSASIYLSSNLSISSTPVPEPATMLLFGTGLVGLVGARMRKKK